MDPDQLDDTDYPMTRRQWRVIAETDRYFKRQQRRETAVAALLILAFLVLVYIDARGG